MSTYRSTGTFLDSNVILNLLFETELTDEAEKVFSPAKNPMVSETVVDECVYVTLRRKAASRGIKSPHELKRFLKGDEGKALLREASELVLSFIGTYGIEIIEDPTYSSPSALPRNMACSSTTPRYWGRWSPRG